MTNDLSDLSYDITYNIIDGDTGRIYREDQLAVEVAIWMFRNPDYFCSGIPEWTTISHPATLWVTHLPNL